VQPVYDGRNYTEPAVYGPYPTKEMRMLFEKTSAGRIRHVGEHIDSETLRYNPLKRRQAASTLPGAA